MCDTQTKPLVIEGFLNLECQEGGSDGWRVDDKDVADRVADHFEVSRVRLQDMPTSHFILFTLGRPQGYVAGDRPIGRVRITIERLTERSTE